MVMAVTGAAAAQPGATPPVEPPPVEAPPVPAADPAWAAYQHAFERADAGQPGVAQDELRAIITAYPGHPAALRAAELVKPFEPEAAADHDAPSKLARGELVFWSTLGGVSIGVNVCQMVECDSERAGAAVFMASVGGSLAASVLLTRHGVRDGEAQLYNSAQTWGAWTGLAINDGFADTPDEAATALAMQAGGLGAGLALWQTWRPSQGDVALTNTFWMWTSVMTTWAHLAIDSNAISLQRIVLAGDAGLVAGMLASTQLEMSRGRTLLIDVGGVLGVLGGALVAIGTDSEEGAGTALMLGTGLGLAAGIGLSKDWDAPKLPVSPAPIAGPHSTGIGLASGFTF